MSAPSVHEQLRMRVREFGIIFGSRTLLPDSQKVFAAAEFARDLGKYDLII
jgi:hypothetical protein